MEIFKLFGTIAINNSDANKSIDESTSKASLLASKVSSAGEKVSAFGSKMSAVGGKLTKGITLPAVAAGTAVAAFATKSATTADKIDKMSQKIGISRKAFQELDFICSQSGTSVDTLQMGMKTLTSAMTGAAKGAKNNVAQFEKLGVSVTNADGSLRSQEEVLFETMSALQGMTNQTEKAKLATELFGRSGSELMPLLNGASGSIEEMKEKAHELGLVMSDEGVDAGVEFTDKIDQVKRSFGAAASEAGTKLLPLLTQLGDVILQKGVPAFGKMVDKVESAVNWFTNLDSGTKKLILTLAGVAISAGPVLSITGKLVTVGGNLMSTFSKLIPVIAGISPPILAIVAVVGVLTGAFITLWNTNEEFRNNVTNTWNEIKATFDSFTQGIVEEINSLGFNFESATQLIQAVWQGFCDFIASPLLEGIMTNISNTFKYATDTILSILKIFTGLFKGDWSKVFEGVKGIATALITFIVNSFKNLYNTINKLTGGKLGELVNFFVTKFNAIKDTTVSVFNSIKSTTTTAWNTIKSAITSPIETAQKTVKKIIDKMKSFFKFDWELPKIKLPHFSISPSGWKFSDLLKGSIPTLGIEWYAKAMNNPMLMTKPTAFGVNSNGQIMAGGEKGAEVVSGADKLMSMITEAVSTVIAENGRNETVNNTFNFTSPKAIDEREATRLFKKQMVNLQLGY